MKTLVVNALVIALCDAEVALLLRVLGEAVDEGWLDGSEEYVAVALARELRTNLPVLEAGEQWSCPTSYRCTWTPKHLDSEPKGGDGHEDVPD